MTREIHERSACVPDPRSRLPLSAAVLALIWLMAGMMCLRTSGIDHHVPKAMTTATTIPDLIPRTLTDAVRIGLIKMFAKKERPFLAPRMPTKTTVRAEPDAEPGRVEISSVYGKKKTSINRKTTYATHAVTG